MNTMLSQLPPDELAGKLFLALYLQRLPAPLRERVAAKHFTDPQQLAEYADTLWEAQTRPLVTAAVLPAAQQPPVTSQRRGWSRGCSSSRPCSDSCSPTAGSLLTRRRRPRQPRHHRPTSVTITRGLAPQLATAAALRLAGKLRGRRRQLTALLPGGQLLILRDAISGRDFLVDLGSTFSLPPHHDSAVPSGPLLHTAHGTPLPTWGIRKQAVRFGSS